MLPVDLPENPLKRSARPRKPPEQFTVRQHRDHPHALGGPDREVEGARPEPAEEHHIALHAHDHAELL
jgi:hypothetical protein